MDIQPVNENLIIEVDKEAEVTAGGVHVAHSKGERTASKAIKGKVVSIAEDIDWSLRVGKDTTIKRTEITLGQTVWIAKWEGQELSYNGKEFIVIKPEHILVVTKGDNKNT